MQENVKQFVARFGIERVGFLTLTFAEHITDPAEARRRFHNLTRRVLQRYSEWVRVFERQKSGRIHYHLLVVLDQDIRTGVNFEAFANGNYGSAGPHLRAEWAFWRNAARAYGFGRTELLPVRSTGEGIGRYVGKYIAKHMEARKDEDKGVRLVGYSRGAKVVNSNFDWATAGAALWRAKLAMFAKSLGASSEDYQVKFSEWFGPKWAFHLKDTIAAIRLPVYRTGVEFLKDHPHHFDFFKDEWGESVDPSECENVTLRQVCGDRGPLRSSAESVAAAYRFAVALREVHQRKQRRPTGDRTSGVEGPRGPAKHPSPFGRFAPCAPALESKSLARQRYDFIGAICR